ncbi:Rho termination protein [filamentous cyanobacterium CCP5]|nr:Rho termination protein [filamentous cyanobacterium CCP5]
MGTEDQNGVVGPAGNPVPPRSPVPSTADNGTPTSDAPPTRPGQGAGGTSFAGAAGLAAGAAASVSGTEDQSTVEASKYNVVGRPVDRDINLSDVDDGLPELPGGYGESRIVLMPRDPEWAYAYWDIPNQHKEELRRQGGTQLALRLYDVTGSSMQQQGCDELARSWYLRIPISDRDYRVEIGYLTNDGRWLLLAGSNSVRIPPVYPSNWEEDLFTSVDWEQDLREGRLATLVPPGQRPGGAPIDNPIYAAAQRAEAQRLSGSLYGSMQHIPGSMMPQQAISSDVFPSGIGMGLGAAPTMSGLNVSGLTMSGVGFSASAPPIRPRKFWLVADAELIVYGATEPDATVTIAGQPIQLEPDGTFRFHMSFQDGNIDYPIMAIAADGEQSRSIHMTFNRETPQRRTNTKAEAQDEWPG